jgi:hypothetical protein
MREMRRADEDVVLDLDADRMIRIAPETRHRAHLPGYWQNEKGS